MAHDDLRCVIGRKTWKSPCLLDHLVGKAKLDRDVPPLNIPALPQPLAEGSDDISGLRRRPPAQDPDHGHRGFLRAHDERKKTPPPKKRNNPASSHLPPPRTYLALVL